MEKKKPWEDWTAILKASRKKHRSLQLYSSEKNGLQQFRMESCQPIKRLKDKEEEEEKKKKKKMMMMKMMMMS